MNCKLWFSKLLTAQGHLETFKNMETRLIESNFSMRGPPLLSHFFYFYDYDNDYDYDYD